ncbi:hypothetical protein COT97_05095 [Candidatus Falkowbacteria bacterium CG10_big_fil_rev_8_21_14_0_10_39_11]|uniref:Uncharacterized protein n=1 Tax=Candidatus Falkowbacteria bacterium CG10_big_fil_rev_8_21_14_0_10_39_11 TaxID=1974565 RepID=A0A2H0V3R0_9BACT|nr:MAG: hypothetical protein COT97_05095 [Candidatus Falkowbacteria bacterium CG10_big_fil_rev_8_21_14_0_10_39_11]
MKHKNRRQLSAQEPVDNMPQKPEDIFICRARRMNKTLNFCLINYVDANAFSIKRTPCYRCPQGLQNRQHFGESAKGDYDGDRT